jgi:hypothetical protein
MHQANTHTYTFILAKINDYLNKAIRTTAKLRGLWN